MESLFFRPLKLGRVEGWGYFGKGTPNKLQLLQAKWHHTEPLMTVVGAQGDNLSELDSRGSKSKIVSVFLRPLVDPAPNGNQIRKPSWSALGLLSLPYMISRGY